MSRTGSSQRMKKRSGIIILRRHSSMLSFKRCNRRIEGKIEVA